MQAIEWGEKLREEQLHLEEMGVALLSSLTLNLNRDPKTPPVKESDFHHFLRKKQDTFPGMVCDAFLALHTDKKLPDFVSDVMDGELLQQLIDGKKGQPVMGCRALVGDGLVLILPRVYNGFVQIPLGMMDELDNGPIEVFDVDYGDRYIVHVAMSENEGCAQVFDDFTWQIEKVL
jgi:hypothetical protein